MEIDFCNICVYIFSLLNQIEDVDSLPNFLSLLLSRFLCKNCLSSVADTDICTISKKADKVRGFFK